MSKTRNGSDSPVSRLDHTTRKLQSALHRLATGTALHPQNRSASRRFTVAALSREAGVSRNAIYTNYRSYVSQLAKLVAGDGEVCEDDNEIQQDNEQLQRLRRLATENACLLKRAIEAEHRADRIERRCASLLRQLDSALSISTISDRRP